MSQTPHLPDGFSAPGPQTNYKRATELGLAAVGRQTDEQLGWLGAERTGRVLSLPVLGDRFELDASAGRMTVAGEGVDASWRILALHYLSIEARPATVDPSTTFADLAASRAYAGVYQGRVIFRFCATAGRDAATLTAAAASLSGKPIESHGDLAYDFQMFPRVKLRLIWHAPDDEFSSTATVLMPANIEEFFCAEDIVVLSESLIARLSGRPY